MVLNAEVMCLSVLCGVVGFICGAWMERGRWVGAARMRWRVESRGKLYKVREDRNG